MINNNILAAFEAELTKVAAEQAAQKPSEEKSSEEKPSEEKSSEEKKPKNKMDVAQNLAEGAAKATGRAALDVGRRELGGALQSFRGSPLQRAKEKFKRAKRHMSGKPYTAREVIGDVVHGAASGAAGRAIKYTR